LRWGISTAAAKAIALARGASTAPAASVLNDIAPREAPLSPVGVGVLSMPGAPKTPSLAAPQSVRATVPHNTAKARNCRGLIPEPLSALHLKARRTRYGRLLDHNRFVHDKKLRVIVFSETCCPNATLARQ
jgi:hypothetical protein